MSWNMPMHRAQVAEAVCVQADLVMVVMISSPIWAESGHVVTARYEGDIEELTDNSVSPPKVSSLLTPSSLC